MKQILERYAPEKEAPDLGSFAYLDHIRQVDPRTGKVYLSSKPGSTRDGPIRKIGLKRDQPGNHNFVKVYRDKHPEAFEELFKELSLPWRQRCVDHPTPTELEYAADLPEDETLGSFRNRGRSCKTEVETVDDDIPSQAISWIRRSARTNVAKWGNLKWRRIPFVL